jgi:hypothetical protein
MARDEGNGGSGGQNLVRFRPGMLGEMSLQLLPAITDGPPLRRGHPMPLLRRRFVSTTCCGPIFSAGTARIWPPLPRNRSLPSGRMKPLETARGDDRRHEKIVSRKQGAREPQPAVSVPLVKSLNGLRSARRRRRGGFAGGRFAHHLLGADLPCRCLPDDLFRRRLLGR